MKPCYCINPRCPQPDHPDNNNPTSRYCYSCGSELLLNGKYRVSRLLSDDSGFGIVYEVFEGFEPKILKVLQRRWNKQPKAVELFEREYEVLLTLTKENIKGIPQAEDFFEYQPRDEKNLYCLVMEKVDGMDLEKWVQKNDKISQKQALKWLKEVTLILQKIHEHNWFHRDIKPANIMMRNSGELVLIDFGTAREETQTYYQKMEGQQLTGIVSTGYTPNEQQNGQSVVQSDFFALGRTFVYLLTAQHPSSLYDPYKDILSWRQETENVDKPLLDFIDHLMAKFPQDRPNNTEAILKDLDNLNQRLQTRASKGSLVQKILTTTQEIVTKRVAPVSAAEATRQVGNINLSKGVTGGSLAHHRNKLIIGAGVVLLGVVWLLGDFNFLRFARVNSGTSEMDGVENLSGVEEVEDSPDRAVEVDGDDSVDLGEAEDFYNQGNFLRDRQDYAQAIEQYTRAIEINGDYVDAFYNRGLTYADLEDYDRAIADYTQAIEIDPEYLDAYNNRGILYASLEDYDRAIADYTQVLEINPNYVLAHNNLGVAYDRLERFEDAIASYTRAIELNPEYTLAYSNRGLSYNSLGDYESAISNFDQALNLEPNNDNAYYYRGNAHNNLGEYQEAIADYTQALEIDSNNVLAYNNRGISYYNLNSCSEAIADYNRALEINPDYPNSYYNRALCHRDLGENQSALADFGRAALLYQQENNNASYQDAIAEIEKLSSN
ncbi:tetratricopeptide repeat protein [Cyanobacterium stanieri LEGE 03274]|uniref:Tetratricopeptide repeat protein n=1 Tax=Cyanobacterium stanieri LEGE 03274 TaxID=1828756 RepID=A0ABR9V548_9CHRO|nr:tetratricopeptide repeat protein [Cyanobacterium stanieri]MBE9221959.1 tetratricopeptide repeat protein [Cyanobacterium stanieri LEGE 03274]